MNILRGLQLIVLLVALAVLSACSGDDDGDSTEDTPGPGASASQDYDEGQVRLEIEYLDTGLLKGHAYADAVDPWIVEAIRVEAQDEQGTGWPVIEPERTGLGSASATEFFEVTIQELPRGQQVSVTTTVTFASNDGVRVERTATDSWPP
jgi:hypothetical protein